MDEVGAVYQHLLKDDHYKTVALDSATEIAEQCLFEELKKSGKDPRKAYGELIQKMSSLIRLFRDLPGKDVIMTAKIERIADDSSRLLYSPAMPGAKLGAALPYWFDLVCPLRVEKDRESDLHRWPVHRQGQVWRIRDVRTAVDLANQSDDPRRQIHQESGVSRGGPMDLSGFEMLNDEFSRGNGTLPRSLQAIWNAGYPGFE